MWWRSPKRTQWDETVESMIYGNAESDKRFIGRLDLILKFNPDYIDMLCLKVLLLMKLERLYEANQIINRVLILYPNIADGLFLKALIMYKTNRDTEATTCFNALQRQFPKDKNLKKLRKNISV